MYYPKSQIKSNLYTQGGEYAIIGTFEEYMGYYYKVSNGQFFTGKVPGDGPNTELIPTIFDLEELGADPKSYSPKIHVERNETLHPGTEPHRYLPLTEHPHPTDDNYRVGSFQRYFAKNISGPVYIEISKETFDNINFQNDEVYWEIYTTLSLFWRLQGTKEEVARANKNSIELVERRNTIIGLGAYLDYNYTQYYKTEEPQNNLFTDGAEFKNRRTGVPYSGPYHIHPENGPMVGATHISSPHDYLDPITPTLTSSQMTPSPSRITPSSPSPSLNRGGGGGY